MEFSDHFHTFFFLHSAKKLHNVHQNLVYWLDTMLHWPKFCSITQLLYTSLDFIAHFAFYREIFTQMNFLTEVFLKATYKDIETKKILQLTHILLCETIVEFFYKH